MDWKPDDDLEWEGDATDWEPSAGRRREPGEPADDESADVPDHESDLEPADDESVGVPDHESDPETPEEPSATADQPVAELPEPSSPASEARDEHGTQAVGEPGDAFEEIPEDVLEGLPADPASGGRDLDPVSEEIALARRRRRTGGHHALPAKVRRRQAVAATVIGALLLFGGAQLFGGGSDDQQQIPPKQLAGQSIIAKLGKAGPSADLLTRARKGQIGGVIVTSAKQGTLPGFLDQLQSAAADGGRPPLLVMVDQEGGEVKRLPGPPDISPASIGTDGTADDARAAGEATGGYLAGLGVNIDLAPVLDVSRLATADTITSRTFGDDPDRVGELGVAFADGLRAGGVLATGKHFPGLGLATINTDFSPVTIAASPTVLDEALVPFKAAIAAEIDLIMVGTAVYPSYGGRTPAAFSKGVIRKLLRRQLGFTGLVVTDDLQSVAVAAVAKPGAAAVRALTAGSDLALFAGSASGSARGFGAVVRAAKSGRLKRARLERVYERILALKADL